MRHQHETTLTTLNLNRNQIGDEGGIAIGKALGVNATLKTLDLSFNQLCGLDAFGKGTYDATGIEALASALEVNATMTDLNLAGNEIGADGGIAIGKALGVNASLTTLNLADNRLDETTKDALRNAAKSTLELDL